jgi:hypothetical protein
VIIDDGENPFKIVGTTDAAVGDSVHKMGMIGGWTAGKVTATCTIKIFSWTPNYTPMCISWADYRGDAGDSGGPIFVRSGTGDNVLLAGIHLGDDGDIAPPPTHAGDGVFSPVGLLYTDLGGFKVWDDPSPPPSLSVSITGPEEVPESSNCIWQAQVSGGSSPFSYQWSGALTGTGSQVSGTVSQDSYLAVLVTDDNDQQAGDEIVIIVNEELEECEF